MTLLSLAWHSLRSRTLTLTLTVLSLALSVALLVGIENVRLGARESFSNTISQTDLIVGARGGSLQLLLYTVFRIGSATNNISFASYEKFRNHKAVAWTIPYSLGDNHRGFRVVGTTNDFYTHFRYRRDRALKFASGHAPEQVFDLALGSDVAAQLGYGLGQKVSVTHGLGAAKGMLDHDEKPFTVVGILERTASPVDRSLYIPLEGITAVHIDWTDGGPPMPGEETPASKITREQLKVEQITSFLLRARSRADTLRLQREINTNPDEPLQAIIPGVALAEMWKTIGYAESALTVVSVFVLVVGLFAMLLALYTSLNERRREMAVLRAIGLGPRHIVLLLVLESGFIAIAGSLVGMGLVLLLVTILQPWIESQFGLAVPLSVWKGYSPWYIAITIGAGFLIGFLPAVKAYRNTLADGLSARL